MIGVDNHMLRVKVTVRNIIEWTSGHTMVPRKNSKQAETNIERATSANLRWYVKDHNVIPNKNVETPSREEIFNSAYNEHNANTDHKE